MSNNNLKDEFIKLYNDMSYADGFIPSKEAILADWFIKKLEQELQHRTEEILGELEEFINEKMEIYKLHLDNETILERADELRSIYNRMQSIKSKFLKGDV